MPQPQLIRYNLKDRGRKFTGQDRNFNIKAICDAVNSPECQERVAARDMQGYLGHWPRVRFGMSATEGGIAGGKAHAVEAAIVTTHLKAFSDGTIEHRTEFLDTASGQIAAKMFSSKIGGFSSAIDPAAPRFYAFDYVANPNYLANSFRGVALDDAFGGAACLTYDDVFQAEQDEHAQALNSILDSIEAERHGTSAVIERQAEEIEQLLSMLARAGMDAGAVLDSAAVRPLVVSVEPAQRLQRDRNVFRTCRLPGFVAPPSEDPPADDPLYDRMVQRFAR